ncbi:class I mannose-6-phosphate isomerase [Paenibacillus sp. MER TA 81-3]|uniref:class I mannose-6-phosphate isomerase n=1 Tax=Paenibacillus sp. MER TA 81-3 TaxID=2939573 RepID=UPI00203BBECC|nr:class I mannose-6-phosphate isomerase [Paenibacillus sp. MER TA 81-3]MCM3338639.1 class I mannose-6-phosphate isomerase [Paenibacillus sp. MER TA 81-3]
MFNKYPHNVIHSSVSCEGDRPLAWMPQGLEHGTEPIAEAIMSALNNLNQDVLVVALDSTHGANMQFVIARIVERLDREQVSAHVYSTTSLMHSGDTLRRQFHRYITDNRAFGYMASDADVGDYFMTDAKDRFAAAVEADSAGHSHRSDASRKQIILLFGPGALWIAQPNVHLSFFFDVSREYQQLEHRKNLCNLGMSWNRDHVETYKICLFLEWPVWETYRKRNLERFDYYVDMNKPKDPVVTTTAGLRRMLEQVAAQPLRVKPFFAPGVWGGQYLKELCDLPQDWVNCAWSFEPIAPENSMLIKYEGRTIEVPFTLLMTYEYYRVMGERPVALFGDYFPVRFDYLDTIDGSNLSCQVHPKQDYVEENFNEHMTQQESYYIMELKDGAKVYLGLTGRSTPDSFFGAVREAQETGVPMPFTDYVNEFDAKKGDLFLIPPGTVHCSGEGNLVLEVSSTTWWFTFKIYDYLRKDLDGKPRPISIEHAEHNVDFDKNTDWVKRHLMSEPQLLGEQGANQEYLLGQHDDLLFCVKRVHLFDRWEDDTNGEFVMYNLVEGERVRLVPLDNEAKAVEFGYAEAYIVPASVGRYRLENAGGTPCKLVKAGVASTWSTPLLPHGWRTGEEA